MARRPSHANVIPPYPAGCQPSQRAAQRSPQDESRVRAPSAPALDQATYLHGDLKECRTWPRRGPKARLPVEAEMWLGPGRPMRIKTEPRPGMGGSRTSLLTGSKSPRGGAKLAAVSQRRAGCPRYSYPDLAAASIHPRWVMTVPASRAQDPTLATIDRGRMSAVANDVRGEGTSTWRATGGVS